MFTYSSGIIYIFVFIVYLTVYILLKSNQASGLFTQKFWLLFVFMCSFQKCISLPGSHRRARDVRLGVHNYCEHSLLLHHGQCLHCSTHPDVCWSHSQYSRRFQCFRLLCHQVRLLSFIFEISVSVPSTERSSKRCLASTAKPTLHSSRPPARWSPSVQMRISRSEEWRSFPRQLLPDLSFFSE